MGAPVRTAPVEVRPAASREWSAFRASLPLLVVSAGLFVGSVAVDLVAPDAGPGGFPLWGLLLTLGFTAAIGTTLSWFFAVGPEVGSAPAPGASTVPLDLGRPAPDVRRAEPATPTPEWDEGPASDVPAALGTGVGTAPRSGAPDDVERALDEIAQIEEELEGRPTLRRAPALARS
jgi:hypothetical protein